MISWQRYGYRMIGSTGEARADYVRRRYLGASNPSSLDLSTSYRSGTTTPTGGGESYTFTPAPRPPAPPPAPVRHLISLHVGPPPAAPAPAPPARTFALRLPPAATAAAMPAAVTATAPPADITPAFAPIRATPECPSCTGKVLAAGVGGTIAGALLMYFVGLATREAKKKRRR